MLKLKNIFSPNLICGILPENNELIFLSMQAFVFFSFLKSIHYILMTDRGDIETGEIIK